MQVMSKGNINGVFGWDNSRWWFIYLENL